MRMIGAAFLATTLVVSNAFAAGSGAGLPAGKPAGVKEAATLGPNFALILVGFGVVVGGLALTISGNSEGVTTPTTTGTASLP